MSNNNNNILKLSVETPGHSSSQTYSGSWDIRREAQKFEGKFKNLEKEEEELYELTMEGGLSAAYAQGHGRKLSASSSTSSSSTTQESINSNSARSIASSTKDTVGYMELLFSFKSKSMELLLAQMTWLQERLLAAESIKSSRSAQHLHSATAIEVPEILKTLNDEIDSLSLSLLQAQNTKNMAIQMADRQRINITELDAEISQITRSLFAKLLKFREVARDTRLAFVAHLQSRIASLTPKSSPLVSLEDLSPPLEFNAGTVPFSSSKSNFNNNNSTPARSGTLKRMVNRVASTLSLSRPKSRIIESSIEEEENAVDQTAINKRKSSRSSILLFNKSTPNTTTTNFSDLQKAQARISDLERETLRLKSQLQDLQMHNENKSLHTPPNTFSIYSITGRTSPSLLTTWDHGKSAWMQDQWRLDSLASFQKDLEFIRANMEISSATTTATNTSIHHERLCSRLESRIAALSLVDPISAKTREATTSKNSKATALKINTTTTAIPFMMKEEDVLVDTEGDEELEGDVRVFFVKRDFEPLQLDEIKLSLGDRVTVTMTFVHGVAHGNNLTTGESGMFPLTSIDMGSMSQPQTPIASMLRPPRHQQSGLATVSAAAAAEEEDLTLVNAESRSQSSFSANGGRVPLSPPLDGSFMFSLTSPQKALAIIAEMPAGERVQYLERLGALTPPPSDKAPSTTTTTTASENWTKLREGWHLALRTQLEDHLQTHNLHQPQLKTLGSNDELPHLEDSNRGKWNDRMRRESFWKMIAENYKITTSSNSFSEAAAAGGGDGDDHEEVVGQETEEVVQY